jgi:hypothetical protein
MRLRIGLITGVLVAVLLGGVPVFANTIGSLTLTNCGTTGTSCPPATYSFNVGSTSATLTIFIPSTDVLGSNNNTITGVDLGFLPQNDFASSSSSVATNFGATWVGSLGSLNNANCGTNGGAFVCATSGTPLSLTPGTTYTWTWGYTLTSQGLIDLGSLSSTGVHIGANYGPASGLIVSCTTTGCAPPPSVPEPSSLLMLGAGLAGVLVLKKVLA